MTMEECKAEDSSKTELTWQSILVSKIRFSEVDDQGGDHKNSRKNSHHGVTKDDYCTDFLSLVNRVITFVVEYCENNNADIHNQDNNFKGNSLKKANFFLHWAGYYWINKHDKAENSEDNTLGNGIFSHHKHKHVAENDSQGEKEDIALSKD